MKSKLIGAILVFVCTIPLNVYGADQINVVVNGKELQCDTAPIIENGRTLIPMRDIFEALGAEVNWNSENKEVSAKKNDTLINMKIDGEMTVNNEIVPLDVSAKIENDRTMVPIRAVSEAFGAGIYWDNSTKTVSISLNEPMSPENAIHPVTALPQLAGPQKGEITAVIHTNLGDIKLWFFPEYAPKAVENFITHSKNSYYDNLTFHRVINGFVIQGGDPEGNGKGGESIWGEAFENEVDSNLKHFRGALCMANAGADTNGSQFYIVQNKELDNTIKNSLSENENENPTFFETKDGKAIKFNDIYTKEVIEEYTKNGGCPSLDFQYTVFGQVYEGMEVVDKIAAQETDSMDKPLTPVIITSIETGIY